MASENINAKTADTTRYVSSKELFDILIGLVNIKRPAMIWGQPGVGKSDVCAQVAEKLGREFIDVRLLLMDPTDLRGIPYKRTNDEGVEEMVWAPAAMFPRDPNSTAIILLDEITAAPPSVQAAALQLVLNRRIGDYKLPDGVSILAAGNRESDKTHAQRMPSALANRFIHLEMRYDVVFWLDWAFDHGINADVIGFLSAFPAKANTFDPKLNSKVFATPRTWTFVSEILNSDMDEDLKMECIAGTVGESSMFELRRHRKLSHHLPNVDDILSGKTKVWKKESKDISLQHALITSLIYRLREYHASYSKKTEESLDKTQPLNEAEWNKISGHFVSFIGNEDNVDVELAIMALTVLFKRYQVLFNNREVPEVRAFFFKHSKLLNFAYN